MKQLLKNIIITMSLVTSCLVIAATNHKVLLVVIPGCGYCSEAEKILDNHGIKYTTSEGNGAVPRLYVDGKYKGTGIDAVQTWVNANK